MNSIELKKEIEDKNNLIVQTVMELNNNKANIIALLIPFINENIKTIISDQIKRSANIIRDINSEKLKNMKKELEDLQLSLNDYSEKELSKDCYWEHTKEKMKCHNTNDSIFKGMRKVFGLAGEIFLKYKLTEATIYGSRDYKQTYWEYPNYSCKEVFYNENKPISKELDAILKAYKDNCITYNNLKYDLESLNDRLIEAEAIEKWEEI